MFKNRLMQLFQDNAKAKKVAIKAEAENGEATIYIYEPIGGWYGLEAIDVVKTLTELDTENEIINIRINSPGGDVFEARAIATGIMQCKAKVVAHIDGVVASAATTIAVSCDEVIMADGAWFMIHNAWTLEIGNRHDMRKCADLLEKVDGQIAKDYQQKTNKEITEIADLMDSETWFTSEEAEAFGFCDVVVDKKAIDNSFNLSAYSNAPKNYGKTNKPENTIDRERFERRLEMFKRLM